MCKLLLVYWGLPHPSHPKCFSLHSITRNNRWPGVLVPLWLLFQALTLEFITIAAIILHGHAKSVIPWRLLIYSVELRYFSFCSIYYELVFFINICHTTIPDCDGNGYCVDFLCCLWFVPLGSLHNSSLRPKGVSSALRTWWGRWLIHGFANFCEILKLGYFRFNTSSIKYSKSRSFQPGAVFSHFTFQADFHFGISFIIKIPSLGNIKLVKLFYTVWLRTMGTQGRQV